ncbi:MAG TPA: DJ-1/PfpI family protein [Spirochaetota bacterium]|nr:DJ-1/PfpI family protein [Spirochaetota bacterium]
MPLLVPLAEGFEEIEAIAIIDLLRRGGVEIVTASLGKNPVTGSHKIPVTADTVLGHPVRFSGIILPGGAQGTQNLKNDQRIIDLIRVISSSNGLTAAICAAPSVLAEAGIMKGIRFTCYPGYENEITDRGGLHTGSPVVKDGHIITAKGAGCAIQFALALLEELKGPETAKSIKDQIMTP